MQEHGGECLDRRRVRELSSVEGAATGDSPDDVAHLPNGLRVVAADQDIGVDGGAEVPEFLGRQMVEGRHDAAVGDGGLDVGRDTAPRRDQRLELVQPDSVRSRQAVEPGEGDDGDDARDDRDDGYRDVRDDRDRARDRDDRGRDDRDPGGQGFRTRSTSPVPSLERARCRILGWQLPKLLSSWRSSLDLYHITSYHMIWYGMI